MYTDCLQSYATFSLPDLEYAWDNSGKVAINIHVDDANHDVNDIVELSAEASPHLLRYTASDESSLETVCEAYISVNSVTGKTVTVSFVCRCEAVLQSFCSQLNVYWFGFRCGEGGAPVDDVMNGRLSKSI